MYLNINAIIPLCVSCDKVVSHSFGAKLKVTSMTHLCRSTVTALIQPLVSLFHCSELSEEAVVWSEFYQLEIFFVPQTMLLPRQAESTKKKQRISCHGIFPN